MNPAEFANACEAEHFVAQCKRELEMYPRSALPEREPHEVVMDESTPALLRKQAA